ncbi:MAG: hypothetical protein ACPGVB_01685 [Chitinophagales bacterium]
MPRIVIAFDDRDKKLGDYFVRLRKHLLELIEGMDFEVIEVPSSRLNQASINELIPKINDAPFLFIAYSHGTSNSLIANNQAYIEVNINTYLFQNALFYTHACSTGKELGRDLEVQKVHAFWGYESAIYVVPDFEDTFIECANWGLLCFLEGETAYQSYRAMKRKYSLEGIVLRQTNFVAGQELVKAKNALVFYGNRNFTVNDLLV